MANAVFFNSYNLKKGASVPDFLLAVETLNNEYISKQEGYVSFELLLDGDTWSDATTFASMDDAKKFAEGGPSAYAEQFYSFLDLSSCKSNFYSVEQSYRK